MSPETFGIAMAGCLVWLVGVVIFTIASRGEDSATRPRVAELVDEGKDHAFDAKVRTAFRSGLRAFLESMAGAK